MTDISLIRKTLAEKYSEACGKIMHPPNQGIVRVLTNPTPTAKSFCLDLIYRGNDRVNFGHRMTDKDHSALRGSTGVQQRQYRHYADHQEP